MQHHMVKSSTRSWHDLFRETARRATELGPERLAGISHASDQSDGTIVLWFHERPRPAETHRWMRSWFVRSSTRSWKSLLDEAARRADHLEDGQLFAITHSCDATDGVVAVWYWVDHDPDQQHQRAGALSMTAAGGGRLSETEAEEG